MKMSYRMGSVQLSKWQLALLVGTPLVFGLGYYVYKRQTSVGDFGGGDTKTRKKHLDLKTKSLSIDGTCEDKELERKKKTAELGDEKLSPLKEANMYKNEGNTCYRNGKFDEAINFYDKAIDKCPPENKTDLAIFYQNRAAAYEMLKKWNKVKDDCSKSLLHNPRYAKAYFRRAKAFEATNDIRECLDDVTATCILEMFQNNNTIMYADRILKQTGNEDAEKGFKANKPILPSKSFVRSYLRSFVSDPLQLKSSAVHSNGICGKAYERAIYALEREVFEDIIAACTEEIESSEAESPYKSEALLLRGTFHLLSGAFAEAQQDLDAVIHNGAADAELRANALIKRASLHIQLEHKDLGLADFDAAEKIQPSNADIYHHRAQIYILMEQFSEAIREFEIAVNLAPNHAMAYVQKCYAEYRLAVSSHDQMRLLMVMTDFRKAIEKFPDCVECYSLMAQVLSDQQQYEQSDQYFEKAMRLTPDNASLYVHRGIMLLQWKGDIDKAIQYMHQALEVDDKCELAYETLGTVEVQRANLNHAVELFESAIKLAKSRNEMSHLYALRNAAVAQINVTRKLGIDMSAISRLAQSNVTPTGMSI